MIENSTKQPLPYPMSESFLADRFVERYCGSWRYCHILKRWFEWDGTAWQEDRIKKIDRLAVNFTVGALYFPEAAQLSPGMKRQICSKYTAGAVRDLAKYDPRIIATPEQLGYVTPKPGMCGVKWNHAKLNP